MILQLTGQGVTGLVPVESLPGKDYRIHPQTLELVTEDGGSRFAVGSAHLVEVRGTDETAGRIELALARDTAGSPASGRRRRRRR